jgi:site-specific DNA-cytosine methylase
VIVANTISRRYGKGVNTTVDDGVAAAVVVVADTLTSGSHPGSNMPGRRREDDTNIVIAFHHLQDPISGPASPSLSKEGMGVAYALRRDPGGTGQGHNTNYVTAFAENQRGELLETPYSHQLTSGGGKPGQGYGAVRIDSGVRRLTPVECERLQGLPDDWTRVPDTAPDSRRYAGLGDAVTSNVGEWIGRRLLEVEASYVKAAA